MASKSNPHYQGKTTLSFPEGQDEMEISPKDLNIVWGRDSRYWKVPSEEKQPAELYQVSWLEVTGSVSNIDPNQEYVVGFDLQFTPDAFGWSSSPIFILVKRGKQGKFAWEKKTFDSNLTDTFEFKKTLSKADNTSQGDQDSSSKLYFGLYEVWSGKWKGGLWIKRAFVKKSPS